MGLGERMKETERTENYDLARPHSTMNVNTEETAATISYRPGWAKCLVCGGSVEPGHGAARLNHRGNTVNLCGLDCRRTFEEDPDTYVARLAHGEACVVCGKCGDFGGGNVRIVHRGTKVHLCGLYCMAAFAKDPDPYLARLAKVTRERALQEAQESA